MYLDSSMISGGAPMLPLGNSGPELLFIKLVKLYLLTVYERLWTKSGPSIDDVYGLWLFSLDLGMYMSSPAKSLVR
jgi:hypothetical protein